MIEDILRKAMERTGSVASDPARTEESGQDEPATSEDMNWFSARVRMACVVENSRWANRYWDSIFVFRAIDFRDARRRAIQLAREEEEEYLNPEHNCVRWRLKELLTLDIIRKQTIDGAEVFCESLEIPEDEDIDFDTVFHPEQSEPVQTI